MKGFAAKFLWMLFGFLSGGFIIAQQPRQIVADSAFIQYHVSANAGSPANAIYHIAYFTEAIPVQAPVMRQLDAHTAVLLLADSDALNRMRSQARIYPANNRWKLSPVMEAMQQQASGKENFTLVFRTASSLKEFLNNHAANHIELLRHHETANAATIRCSYQYLFSQLLPLETIVFIDRHITAHTEAGVIGYRRHWNRVNQLDYLIPAATGKNIVVGVKEQKMDMNDVDLHKRILPSTLASATTSEHATSIATLIGGAGNSFYDGRGPAHAGKFFSSSFDNLFADDGAVLQQQKISVQNHSYGTVPQQFYGAEAVSYDAQAWQQKNLLHIFSSGNRGTAAATEGPYTGLAGYANITGNFKMAKNVMTVGAIDDKGNIATLSSAGPLYDGRLAPQLTALGANGTSDAAAMVSGTAAVLQQVYADSNAGVLPAASLVKALLYNTATDIGRTGIDYKTGYGLLNSYEAVKALQQKKYDDGAVTQGQTWTKNITVPANSAALKVTLCWTDSTAQVNNNKALINDLDLVVEETGSGTSYRPWVLSNFANTDSLVKLPVRRRDSLNTSEQVSIALPASGNYQLRVSGTAVRTGTAAFHIAHATDTLNTFSFTNPIHTSDVNSKEEPELVIGWRTFIADTSLTGNLHISYDNGGNWQLLANGVKLAAQQYRWLIKDTASTAWLRMQTPFGNFQSNRFVISPVVRMNVDFLCADSFQLSWNRHVYANAYRIYALTDSAYLKPIVTTTDSFRVFNRATNPSLVYAVEPVLNNSLPAARSISVDIGLQGVNCFYRSFNYTLLDSGNVSLLLELGTTNYVDSVSFERITENLQVLQKYAPQKVVNGVLIYEGIVNGLRAGTHYFRARIRLKNGGIVYTDKVALLTPGDRIVLLYPNPVRAGGPLQFLLKSQADIYQLQLLDGFGRFIRSWEVRFSGNIKLPVLPAGIYFYRLVDANGRRKEDGKIVITN
jgi:hypothetical protein